MNETYQKTRLEKIGLFVLDMDGTVYLGERVIDGAREFILRMKEQGRRTVFFTNNSSRNSDVYYQRLTKMGFSVLPNEIVTSGDVTIEYLNTECKGKTVYLLGTPMLEESFIKGGIKLSDGKKADIVVSAFDTTLTYEKLDNACRLIRGGAEFFSTHPDFNCPTESGFIPDSGAICAFITASTGIKPRYFGKPYRETAQMISKLFNTPFENTAVVGDRLYTDIALGKNNGILSILVLTGETKMADINDDNCPDLVFDSINCILNNSD